MREALTVVFALAVSLAMNRTRSLVASPGRELRWLAFAVCFVAALRTAPAIDGPAGRLVATFAAFMLAGSIVIVAAGFGTGRKARRRQRPPSSSDPPPARPSPDDGVSRAKRVEKANASLRTTAAIVGSLAATVALSACFVRLPSRVIAIPVDLRLAIAFVAVLPAWMGAACVIALVKSGLRAWAMCAAVTGLAVVAMVSA